jgi:hypothetical protein
VLGGGDVAGLDVELAGVVGVAVEDLVAGPAAVAVVVDEGAV